jgi:hypothetical protein
MTLVSFVILYAAAILPVACNRETATKSSTAAKVGAVDLRNAKIKETISTAVVEQTTNARLGSRANPDGLVIEEKSEFKSGEPLVLSMTVKQSPSGLQMSAVWRDDKGKVLDQERKDMKGAKIATFGYGGKKLKPGNYAVTGYWGGNIAGEKKFRVVK